MPFNANFQLKVKICGIFEMAGQIDDGVKFNNNLSLDYFFKKYSGILNSQPAKFRPNGHLVDELWAPLNHSSYISWPMILLIDWLNFYQLNNWSMLIKLSKVNSHKEYKIRHFWLTVCKERWIQIITKFQPTFSFQSLFKIAH